MSYVVTLEGLVPPVRYDGHPWTAARISESATPSGPWSVIDAQTLPSPDADPTLPAARNLTTTLAALPVGWYQVTFVDAGGGLSEPSDAIRSAGDDVQLPPSPTAIRSESPLLRQGFPVPATDPSQIRDLRNVVYQSIAQVQALTWRVIDSTLGCAAPEGEVCELVPDSLVPIAVRAVALMSERLYVTSQPRFASQIATGRRLRGFSAGPYSESYFAPGEFSRRGVVSRPAMDADDALDSALWALATEDARDYFVWRSTGVAPPVGVATGFDYRRLSLGYAAGSGGLGGGYGRGGPDGF